MGRSSTHNTPDGGGPLAGLRVLDLTWAMAGPYCTLQLALLGAQVIKVETAASPDAMRRGAYALEGHIERSPTFNSLNLHKLGLRLNLKTPEGRALFKGLAAVSDAVVENFRPGVIRRMGLGYEALAKVNPTIILASSSAFGAEGPEAFRPGYASIFSSMSSVGHLTGYDDGPPAELRDSIDLRVGTSLAYAILAAVYHRQRTGQGQYIDLSSMEAVIGLVGHTVMGYLLDGRVPKRQSNRDDAMAPHGVYPCAGDDQWVAIAAATDAEFAALCRVIGKPSLPADPRFADGFQRHRHQDALDAEIAPWTARRSPREATEALQAVGVAATPVFSNRDLVEDRHARERGVWTEVAHPVMGPRTVQRLPWKATPPLPEVERPAPLLGQHNGYLLGEVLGLSPQEIERLAEAGVFQ